ncbi:RHS repeat-associated core domain-containing protein [Acidovorax sp. FG27]|uniref:RHS repeat-associated core domain-containing protein n=1 Tax=Acidovorax sp. FG27 TaxID=3133652 RepID=UPI0030E84FF0
MSNLNACIMARISYVFVHVAALCASQAAIAQTLPIPPASPVPVIRYEYDTRGNPTHIIKAPDVAGFGFTNSITYDQLSRPKDWTDPDAGTTSVGYDAADNVISVTDPRSLQTFYPRNGFGEVRKTQSPDTGTATVVTDTAGNVTRRTDSRGIVANYAYDGLNRLRSASYSLTGQTTQSFAWTYDQTGTGFTNGIGRLTSSTFAGGSTRYAYDALGRLTSALQTLDPATGANTSTVSLTASYTYSPSGNLASVGYPSGRVLTTAYAQGLPTTLSLAAATGASSNVLMSAIKFAPFGSVQSWNWATTGGAVAHTRVFDASGRLVRYPLGKHVRDVSYDAAGRISRYTHYLRASASTGTAAPALDQQFGHDKLDRLVSVTGATGALTYTYDANGNRTSVATGSGAPAVYTIASTSNRLLATAVPTANFSYDAAGSMTADGNGITLGYDLRQRLATLTTTAGTTRYTYDAGGQRVRKAGPATGTVLYVYDPQGQLLGEYDSAGRAIREYVWLHSMPVAIFTPQSATSAVTAPPVVYYLHADHLGTPRVAMDTSGNVRWSWLADPFGASAANEAPTASMAPLKVSLRLPGQVFDQESGLHYNYMRDYFPGTGRYVQSDPIGLEGGINTYAYVEGSPLSYLDPKGLQVRQGSPVLPYSGTITASRVQTLLSQIRQYNSSYSYQAIRPSAGPESGYTHADIALLMGVLRGYQNAQVCTRDGVPIGRFIAGHNANVMIEPAGGSTVPYGRFGVDTHTLFPNGSNFQRINPNGHPNNPTPHGHGHLMGTGPGRAGQGPSVDVNGNVVPANSGAAHWPIN